MVTVSLKNHDACIETIASWPWLAICAMAYHVLGANQLNHLDLGKQGGSQGIFNGCGFDHTLRVWPNGCGRGLDGCG